MCALTPDLALPFGHVVNSRRPQLEESLFPGLLAVFLEVQHGLQVRHDDGGPTEVFLQKGQEIKYFGGKKKLSVAY